MLNKPRVRLKLCQKKVQEVDQGCSSTPVWASIQDSEACAAMAQLLPCSGHVKLVDTNVNYLDEYEAAAWTLHSLTTCRPHIAASEINHSVVIGECLSLTIATPLENGASILNPKD